MRKTIRWFDETHADHKPNPIPGRRAPTASYLIKTAWDGDSVVLGAGGTCPTLPEMRNTDEVNAAGLAAAPSQEKLQAFARYPSMGVSAKCCFGRNEFESSSLCRHSATCVLVMDIVGNQLLTGNSVQLNVKVLHEWGGKSRPADQFGGRDMAAVGDGFGEALINYRDLNPMTSSSPPKIGVLKRSAWRLTARRRLAVPAC